MTEKNLLASLGLSEAQQNDIIHGKKRLLLLDASAHMDWDWLLPFSILCSGKSGGYGTRASWYFSSGDPGVGSATDILNGAEKLLAHNEAYRYSVCETGFLRGFALGDPKGFAKLLTQGEKDNRFRSEGGGITSPDNLLSHGEAFIRNYLEGHQWIAENAPSVSPGKTIWIPDDFGHDPQLPVVAEAMGMIAAGFARMPGTSGPTKRLDGKENLVEILTKNKIDFTWTAADGSSFNAHWLIGNYGQGNTISSTADISTYLDLNLKPSPTPYIYVPVLSDFSLPNTHLPGVVTKWNNRKKPKANDISDYQNVIAVCASFEVYAQLINFHSDKLEAPYGPQFNANPFWTGCYGSRPAIKIHHQRAVRNLLAAEVFSLIAGAVNAGGGSSSLGTGCNYTQLLSEAWNLILPSTHHDYITGTAIPDVYHSEQMALLRQADERAKALRNDTMRLIASSINAENNNMPALVTFNPLGFARTGIAEIKRDELLNVGFTNIPASAGQITPEGNLLFNTTVPAMGYQFTLLSNLSLPKTLAGVSGPTASGIVTLSNEFITAKLTQNNNGIWGLTSVLDVAANKELVPVGAVMNELKFYADNGDEYRFGMEQDQPGWYLTDVSKSCSNPTITIIENGPLRVIVRTGFTYTDQHCTINYIQDYILYAGESQLRMRSSGAAPPLSYQLLGSTEPLLLGGSVVAAFPLLSDSSIDTLVRGTPNHWTDLMPPLYWNDQTFMATHNFVIPQKNKKALCAIYHSDIPAWGLSNQPVNQSRNSNGGTLYGSLWRNGYGKYYGWVANSFNYFPLGTDPEIQIREYALRMPSSLQGPETGMPLQESLAFADSMKSLAAVPLTAVLPQTLSLASCSDPAAILTVMKPGTVNPENVVMRIYQPTNKKMKLSLTIDPLLNPSGKKIKVKGQTALEQDLGNAAEKPFGISAASDSIEFTALKALTTLTMHNG